MTRYADIDYRLSLRPRGYGGRPFDLSPWVESLSRSKSLRGSSAGSWSASVVFNDERAAARRPQLRLTTPDSLGAESIFRGRVRDDDWGELEIVDRESGARSSWEILTDSRSVGEVYAEGPAAGRDYQIAGRDWSKCLTDGEIRLGALYTSAEREVNTFGSEVWAKMTTVIPPRMPGFVDFLTWNEFMKPVVEGAALSMTVSEPLKKILAVLLWNMWVDPDNTPLWQKLVEGGLSRFGPVSGCAWQLLNLLNQQTVTPDQILRQIANPAWTEVIYTMNAAQSGPAIILRRKPFLPREWSQLPVTVLDTPVRVQASQSGAERLTYYRPNAAIGFINGYDMMIDTRSGRMPIIERSQLKYHGVRPGEPTDDHYPPVAKVTEGILEWYRRRIGIFRRWYYWNAEYLSGTVELPVVDPRVQVGQRIQFPLEWEFQIGSGRTVQTSVIEAYVTDVTDTIQEGPEGRDSSTTVAFVRGQPPGGLPVPAVERWTSGAKRLETIQAVGLIETTTGAYVIVNGQKIGMPFVVTHSTALRVGGNYTTRATAPIALIVHQTDGTSPPYRTAEHLNEAGYSTHFVIYQDGSLWQFLDPWTEKAWHTGGDDTDPTDYNATSWGLDFTGNARSGFAYTQKATFLALLQAVVPALPTMLSPMPGRAPVLRNWPLRFVLPNNPPPDDWPQVTETPAQWAAREGVVLGNTAGMFAHQQVQSNRSDPSSPANDPTFWDSLRAGVLSIGY